MSTQNRKDDYDDLFEEQLGQTLVFYTTSGRAATGALRSFTTTTVRFDSVDGTKGGSVLSRKDITMVTVATSGKKRT